MQRTILGAKIHRVTVTQCELHYEGSCAIDEDILEAADIREFQQIEIWNINNGERLTTYAIKAQRGSGTISVNGSAARRAAIGDLVIIAAFVSLTESELAHHQPKLVFVDERNRISHHRGYVPVQVR